ncbi:MAG: xanthine dehydrogenase, partial [Alphaproteobacteria bacterium]|nr:xanthine dehydrogenase [Alphaproteobacteria bacterium]
MKLALAKEALAAARSGGSAAIATNLRSGLQSLVQGAEKKGDLPLDAAALSAVERAIRDDRSATVETPDGPVFIEVFNPSLRCFIVGAVHIAQPLAQMAALAGYAVTVID